MTDDELMIAVAVSVGLLYLYTDDDDGGAFPSSPSSPALAGRDHGQHADTVALAKQIVIDRGVDISTICGAFEITKQAAWMLRDIGAGLVDKPTGTQCDGYSVDGVMFQDGAFYDVLIGKTSVNGPAWSHSDNIDPGRWRSPLQMEG